MIELLIATRNARKLAEIRDLLAGLKVKVTSLADYKDMPHIEEDGKTFAENAIKKAATISLFTGKLVMGEDSGIQVRALKNAPGIYSARFSGEGATDKKNNDKLLRLLKNVPLKKRQARYRCFVALTDDKGIVDVISGSCQGMIALKPKGANGFGYDPLFVPKGFDRTFGELEVQVKSRISHRARALKKFKRIIGKYLAKR